MKIDFRDVNNANLLAVSHFGAALLDFSSDYTKKWNELPAALKGLGASEVIQGRVRETDTEWAIVRHNQDLIIIIPGTESFKDAKVDISYSNFLYWMLNRGIDKETYSEFMDATRKLKLGTVHRGFAYAGYLTYKAMLPHLVSLASRGYKNVRIFGHSYGGAVKSFLSLFISGMKNTRIVASIGFGAPGHGKSRFQKIYSQLVNGFEFVNQSDMVPLLPPKIFGWKYPTPIIHFLDHNKKVKMLKKLGTFAKERWQGRKGNKEWDGARDHKVFRYEDALLHARREYNILYLRS